MARKRPREHSRKGYVRKDGTFVRGTVVNEGLIEDLKARSKALKRAKQRKALLNGEAKNLYGDIKEDQDELEEKITDAVDDSESELGEKANKIDDASVEYHELKEEIGDVKEEEKEINAERKEIKKEINSQLKEGKKAIKEEKKAIKAEVKEVELDAEVDA